MCITYPSSGKLVTRSLLLGKYQSMNIMGEKSHSSNLNFRGSTRTYVMSEGLCAVYQPSM